MIYPKDQKVRDVARQTNRTPEEIYRLLKGMNLSLPVGAQMLEGFFAQTLVAMAIPVSDTYGLTYG